MNITTGPKKQRTQVQRTKAATARLRAAAMEQISEEGVKSLTLAAIGTRAGVSRELVRYHFGSKAGLVRHILDKIFEDRLKFYDQCKAAGITGIDAIYKSFDMLPDRLEKNAVENRCLSLLIIDGLMEQDPEIRQRVRDYSRAVRDHVEENFRITLVKKSINPDPYAAALADVYVATSRGIVHQWLLRGESFDVKRAVNLFKGFIDSAISKSKKETKPPLKTKIGKKK